MKPLIGQAARIMLVDDHPLFRQGLAALIAQSTRCRIVAEAGLIDEALTLVGGAAPDLIIVDISLQGQDGLELVRILRKDYPQLPVLVLSMHDEEIYAERAIRAGARGYVMKHSPPDEILDAIRRVLDRELALGPAVRDKVLESLEGGGSGDLVGLLSSRELEVFRYFGQGFGLSEIAERMSISVKTVNTYRDHLKTKLRCGTVSELRRNAVEWMRRNG